MLRLTLTKDGERLAEVDCKKDDIILGRGGEADVSIPSEAVSRRHARLTRRPDGWQVADLGAANGVYVQKRGGSPERVVIERVVPGDRILIESYVITFEESVDFDAVPARTGFEDLEDESSLANRRTRFISMTDLLEKAEQKPSTAQRAAPPQARAPTAAPPQPAPAAQASTSAAPAAAAEGDGRWWVRLSSLAGHNRVFPIEGTRASVGAGKDCHVKLPNGPERLVELERLGPSVSLKRLGLWPFPRVHVDGRSVKEAVLSDRDGFSVGDFEVTIHLGKEPLVRR